MTGTISQVLISTLVCTQFHLFRTQDCWSFQHYCLSSDSCIGKWNACDGNCPNDYPNLCDNGTVCYPNYFINDQSYFCADRSDEHQPTENPSELDNSSVDKFLQLKSMEKNGLFGVDCQDRTMQTYNNWCKDIHKRMCGGVSTTDYFICTNSSLWEDRSCSVEKVRGCKLPGRCFQNETKCDGQAGSILECGPDDYSDEVCPVNKENLKNHIRYFTCKDNSALIHPTLVCDGYKHCDDSSDENKCNICPRTNGMVVHGQVVQLKSEEIRDFDHLKNTAIMKCESPYGLDLCATPGDGNPECVKEMKDGLWQTQDEVELKPATLWRTFFTYMAYIFLISVVLLFKISQLGDNCQKYTSDVPILKSYHRRIPFDDESFPQAIPMRSCPIFDSYLTFPWAIAFQAANERHQILMALGDCYGVKGTVEMEDTSLDRLWWGHWILPIVMAVFGLLNYGWFRIYVKHGHPWRRLLSSDKERVEEWKTLELWEMLQNKTDDDGEVETVDNWSMQEAVPVVLGDDAFTDIVVSLEVIENQEADIANEREKYKEGKLNMGYEIREDGNRKQDGDSLNKAQQLNRIDIEEIHKLKLKSDDKAEDVIFKNVSTKDKIHDELHDDDKNKVQDSVKGSVPINTKDGDNDEDMFKAKEIKD